MYCTATSRVGSSGSRDRRPGAGTRDERGTWIRRAAGALAHVLGAPVASVALAEGQPRSTWAGSGEVVAKRLEPAVATPRAWWDAGYPRLIWKPPVARGLVVRWTVRLARLRGSGSAVARALGRRRARGRRDAPDRAAARAVCIACGARRVPILRADRQSPRRGPGIGVAARGRRRPDRGAGGAPRLSPRRRCHTVI